MAKTNPKIRKAALIFIGLDIALLAGLGVWKFVLNRTPVHQIEAVGDPAAPAGSEEKFDFLASQSSNGCGLQAPALDGIAGGRIQGSCCSPMDLHAYQEQVEALKSYQEISEIPPDPYDISIEAAKQLLAFKDEIVLTSDQQETYAQAAELSEEGGPCCCKCWHWDAYEGLAKKMIADYGWSAEQIAELWDHSNACGGTHDHG